MALYSRFDVIVCRLTSSPLISIIMLQQITFICTKQSLKLVSSAFTWTEFGCTEKLQQPEHDDAGGHSEPLVLHWGGAEVLPSRDPRNHHWSDRWGWGSSFYITAFKNWWLVFICIIWNTPSTLTKGSPSSAGGHGGCGDGNRLALWFASGTGLDSCRRWSTFLLTPVEGSLSTIILISYHTR